ncbi:hypothetical protein NDU88_008084 [Pleurodeles waltl]|uniref:Uncharacterized protein n=1 Tax=Pleurodeles waltl TaxID=8319 RepID=A0AAV7RRB7_PLEWA|nr:hypothetical protein NDU88_008084 [Pleurodeles waltl]
MPLGGRVQDGDRVGRINRSSDPAYNKDPEQRRLDPLRGRKPSPVPRNQQDGSGGERSIEGAAWGTWLAPDLWEARGAHPRRTIALGGARMLLALKIGATGAATAWSDGAPQKAVGGGLPA